jgi:glycosyltransferase involved in cell wall biosynthesis
MPKISVLLPVYNTDSVHLRQAIDSILAQTYTDFELIIVNDASTQSHVDDVVKSYSDPRIQYHKLNKNMGISAVRNMMASMAQGSYLAVMDHDDCCLPTRFEKQVAVLDKHADIILCGTAHKRFGTLFKNNIIRYPQDHDTIKATLFFKCVVHHPSVMMRRAVFELHAVHYDETYMSSNDRKLYVDLSQYGKLHNLQDVLCLYRLHPGMTSKTKRKIIVEDQKRLRTEFLERMGVELSDHEKMILDQYITSGRSRIKEHAILVDVNSVLTKLVDANNKSAYFPPVAFAKLCATYLVKRCLNAAFYGRVKSNDVLAQTALPIAQVRIPVWFKIFQKFMA